MGSVLLPIEPGTGFFAVTPSRHRYYLPKESPGWTFAWIGIYHPYLVRRISKQVDVAGPLVRATPSNPLITRFMRLVQGAFRKDWSDRYEVERELFDFTLAFERMSERARSHPERDALLAEIRKQVLASPGRPLQVDALAAERGVSRSAFSHFFRARTGLTPAHFMTEVRVQEAARLLETTDLDLGSIARACGFANGNHFGKVFRRFRHEGADAYRRALR